MADNLASHFDLSNPDDVKMYCFIKAFNKSCSDAFVEAGRSNKSPQDLMHNSDFELNLLRNTKNEMINFIKTKKGE